MAYLQRNKVVIYSFVNGSATVQWRAYVVTVAAAGTQTIAQVGAGHASLDDAKNAVIAAEGADFLRDLHSSIVVGDVALVGA